MKRYEEIHQALVEAVGQPEEATEETVASACQAVLEKATEQFGPGVYVSGRLNYDMQGISFRYKRPSIGQREQFFVPCNVPAPEVNQDEEDDDTGSDDTSSDDSTDTGSSQDASSSDRLTLLQDAAASLGQDDFTADGRPHVDPVNDHLPEDAEQFTAKERDELWAQRTD